MNNIKDKAAKWITWTAILSAIGLVADLLGIRSALYPPSTPTPIVTPLTATPTPIVIQQEFEYSGRVLDATGARIEGAKVTLEYNGSSREAYTDSEGLYRFRIESRAEQLSARIIIDARGYKIYSRRITLSFRSELEEIRLTPIPAPTHTAGIPTSAPEAPTETPGPTPTFTITPTPEPVELVTLLISETEDDYYRFAATLRNSRKKTLVITTVMLFSPEEDIEAENLSEVIEQCYQSTVPEFSRYFDPIPQNRILPPVEILQYSDDSIVFEGSYTRPDDNDRYPFRGYFGDSVCGRVFLINLATNNQLPAEEVTEQDVLFLPKQLVARIPEESPSLLPDENPILGGLAQSFILHLSIYALERERPPSSDFESAKIYIYLAVEDEELSWEEDKSLIVEIE